MMKNIRTMIALLLFIVLLCGCSTNQTPDPTETIAPSNSDNNEMTYSVSIVDPTGKAVSSGVIVSFLSGSDVVAMQTTDASGVAQKVLPKGEYTVTLGFTDPNAKYHYNSDGLSLTAEQTQLEVVLAYEALVEEKSYNTYDPNTGEEATHVEKLYYVSAGCTYIPLSADERTYVYFTPEVAGLYQFSVVGQTAAIGYYGSPYFIQDSNLAELDENGAFTVNVSKGMIGTNGTGTSVLVLGIDGEAEDCIICIERIGEPEMTIEDYPWHRYEATVEIGKFTMGENVTVVDFDLTADGYTLVLNSGDGYYHLNTEDGPVVYAKLGVSSEYLDSVEKILESSGFVRYFYDEDGNFDYKVSYTQCLLDYVAAMDENTGLYPLTEDLAHIFQQRGEFVGWWDVSGPSYIFVDENRNPVPGINPDIAWLFLCCYADTAEDPDVTEPAPDVTEPSTEPSEPEHVHSYNAEIVAPGCTTSGYTVYTCDCGDQYTGDAVKPAGHIWGEWKETKPATETEVGERQRICINCEETEHEEIPKLIPEHTHAYTSAVTKEPTCTAEGQLTYTCQCGDQYTEALAKVEHTYVSEVIPPSCTEGGYTSFNCTNCDHGYASEMTDATGHSWGAWEETKAATETEKGERQRVCANCGAKETSEIPMVIPEHTHSYTANVTKEATCTAEGEMTFTCACGASYTESISKIDHDYEQKDTESTCTERGYTTHICTGCGDSYMDNYQPLLEHTYTAKVTKEPTCTEEGKTTYSCSCGASYTEPIAKIKHSYTATTVDAPTCTEEGKTTYSCSCGASYTEPIAKTEHSYTTTTVVAPTCAKEGYTMHSCACGDNYRTDATPMLDHTWGSWEYSKAGTTDTNAEATRTCTVCNGTDTIRLGKKWASDDEIRFFAEEFTISVGAGEYNVYNFARVVSTMCLSVKSDDAYVVCDDVVYFAKNGSVDILFSAESAQSIVQILIGNLGDSDAEFTVKMGSPLGSQSNPEALSLGTFTTELEAGNEVGYYYTYTATKSGTMTVTVSSVTQGTECDVTLYNLNTYVYRNMQGDGDGTSVSVEVNAGDVIQVNICAVPEDYEYPASTIVAKAEIQ